MTPSIASRGRISRSSKYIKSGGDCDDDTSQHAKADWPPHTNQCEDKFHSAAAPKLAQSRQIDEADRSGDKNGPKCRNRQKSESIPEIEERHGQSQGSDEARHCERAPMAIFVAVRESE